MRVGLVLGAGGVVGQAYHAGVLAALEETGWDPRQADIIVGTSAGSMAGVLLRAGIPARDLASRALGEEMSDQTRRRLSHITPPTSIPLPARRRPGDLPRPSSLGLLARAAATPWRLRPGVVLSALIPEGRVPTAMIADGLRPLFSTDWPTEAFWVCAVRLSDGRRIAFGREGSPPAHVADAVAASCAIPGYFAPVTIGGQRYVDGGAHSPTNLDLLAPAALDLIVVSSPMSARRPPFNRPARALFAAGLAGEAAVVRRRGTALAVFQPTPDDVAVMGVNAMDPARRGAVARQARESALRRLEKAPLGLT